MARGGERKPGMGLATWVFLSPWFLSFLVFGLFPIGFSFFLSFHEYSPIRPDQTRFLGFDNYLEAFGEAGFWTSIRNTLFFTFGTLPFTTVLALALALSLDRAFPGRTLFRAGFFLPSVVSVVVLALVFKGMYSPGGPLNDALRAMGFQPPAWLLDPDTALPAIMAMDVWAASGYYMIIFLAGLKAIPQELYESAELDGAGFWAKLWGITLPLLRPTFLFVLVVNTVRSLQIFTEVFVMTRGGPLDATLTAVYYLYEEAFFRFRLGYASSVAYVLFGLTLILAVIQFRWLKFSGSQR